MVEGTWLVEELKLTFFADMMKNKVARPKRVFGCPDGSMTSIDFRSSNKPTHTQDLFSDPHHHPSTLPPTTPFPTAPS